MTILAASTLVTVLDDLNLLVWIAIAGLLWKHEGTSRAHETSMTTTSGARLCACGAGAGPEAIGRHDAGCPMRGRNDLDEAATDALAKAASAVDAYRDIVADHRRRGL